MRACLAIALLFCLNAAPAAASLSDFVEYSFTNSSGTVLLPGRLYVPPEAATSPRPVILFMVQDPKAGDCKPSEKASSKAC